MFESVPTSLAELWDTVREVWNTGIMGYSFGDMIIAFGIFLGFYILRGLFSRFIFSYIDRWVADSSTKADDMLHSALSEPLRFVFIILGVFFAFQYLNLAGAAGEVADNTTRSLIAIAIFWCLRNAITPLGVLLQELETVLTSEMIDWLITGAKWTIIFVGVATILQLWGIQVAPIIAGFGLFGVAVALGAQDLFKNLIGGLSILVEKRFSKGDWIKVDGVVEGTVEAIGFRSTHIRRFDKAPVFVPNTELSNAAITNFSAMTHRRIYWMIGLEYRSSAEQLAAVCNGIQDYISTHEDFAQPPEVAQFVRVDSFGPSSIDVMLYCFTKTTDWGQWLEIKEALAFKIKDIVEEAGTGFAFPSQSIYVESMPVLDAPENFTPPVKA
ncbi:MAG: MscS family membrane protein [Parvibaculaceae bacterium]|jgi:MscS family membrane protein|nr:mechanosensitive ion channel family protein [Parvibaculaceae bacterium]